MIQILMGPSTISFIKLAVITEKPEKEKKDEVRPLFHDLKQQIQQGYDPKCG